MQILRCLLGLACLIAALPLQAQSIRPPAYAGAMYPKEPQNLLSAVRKHLDAVPARNPQGRLVAAVVPHSAYPFSGDVIAAGLKELQPGQYDRVIVLAPGHMSQPEGCSIPDVETFATPLGQIFLDEGAIRTLCFSSLYEFRSLNYPKDGALIPGRPLLHEFEYSVEVILPFLQERLGVFRLIPIIVGNFHDTSGTRRNSRLETAADTLRKVIDDRTLVIVSTDWTHYGDDFGFKPFKDNIAASIEDLDRRAMNAIVNRDSKEFRRYMANTRNTICGAKALEMMLEVLPRRAAGELIRYDRSMNKTQKMDRSVSYAAINFYDPSAPAAAARPERRLVWNFNATAPAAPAPPAPATEEAPLEPSE